MQSKHSAIQKQPIVKARTNNVTCPRTKPPKPQPKKAAPKRVQPKAKPVTCKAKTSAAHLVKANNNNQNRNANQRNNTRGLPRSTPSRPLANIDKQDRIHDNLKQKSPWYQAIMDPAQGAGVKIPDDVAVETGTLQLSFESSFVTGNTGDPSAGIGGWRMFTPYPNAIGGVGENYQTLDLATSTPSNLGWLAGIPFTSNDALRSYSRAVRIASAALYVEPEVSLANAQGEMILTYDIFGLNGAIHMDDHRNSFGAAIMPLNQCKPMKTCWTPASRNQNTYKSFFDTAFTQYGPNDDQVPTWQLQVLANGCAPAQTFRVRCVVNYEFIPYANAIDILSANPSPVDATEVDLVETWVADTPATRPSSAIEMSTAPGAGVLENSGAQDGGPTGFGMFFDVVTEILPEALDMLGVLL